MHIFHVGAFFGHSGEIVPSESFDVTIAAVGVQVPILEGRKFRVWNILKILQLLPGALMPLCPYFPLSGTLLASMRTVIAGHSGWSLLASLWMLLLLLQTVNSGYFFIWICLMLLLHVGFNVELGWLTMLFSLVEIS